MGPHNSFAEHGANKGTSDLKVRAEHEKLA